MQIQCPHCRNPLSLETHIDADACDLPIGHNQFDHLIAELQDKKKYAGIEVKREDL